MMKERFPSIRPTRHRGRGDAGDSGYPSTLFRRGRRWVGVAVAGIAAIAAGVSGCALVSGAPTAETGQGKEEAFAHIHGLGVDETNGDLFVSTHSGVFRVSMDAGRTAMAFDGPIAGNEQDTMGFTIVDGVMFGSGHPDPTGPDAEMTALGLVISTDRAKSWDPVSLAGQADFHDIAAAGSASDGYDLYAYDGAMGAVRVSTDSGKTWSTGANVLARDLTFDSKSGTLYATTEEGLAASLDKGMSFAIVPEAPLLYLVEALNDGSGGLIGVDLDGSVWSKRAGERWRETGEVTGPVEALAYTAEPSPLLIVADTRGVSTSADLGGSWQTIVAAE